jgi:Xaa-Pro aminopeptidase
VIELREIKEAGEIVQIEKAVTTSAEMHFRALEYTRAGMKEYEPAAQIEAVAKMRNSRFAYPLIFTVNGEILHNHGQHNTIKEGKLILCDAGAENEMRYAGDLTRTFPANNRFSGQQKEIYETVLKAMDHAIGLLAPGVPYMEVHRAAAETIVDGLKAIGLMKGDTKEAVEAGAHALFFPHGLGHMLGLDVHDMEALGEDNVGYSNSVKRKQVFGWKSLRLGNELKEGFVLTVEPGIYFIPGLIDQWSTQKMHSAYINFDKLGPYQSFGGIRVEDNYYITSTGSRKMGKHLPKTIAEIEDLRGAQ